jgi:hypothetical protein
VDETNVLVTDNLDLVNETKATKVIAELLLGRTLIKPTKIDVTARIALTDGEGDLARDRGRLSPTNLELLAMQRELFDGRIGVECAGSGAIKEGEENTRLFREDSDRLERAKVNKVEEFVNGCSCGEVADVDRATGGVIGGGESGSECRSRVVARRREGKRGRPWSAETLLLCDAIYLCERVRTD